MTGVLDQYLASVNIKVEPELVMEEEPAEDINEEGHCCVCNRETEDSFKDRTVCVTCKKFFLRCVKTRCYKDFYCSNDSKCDIRVKTPCSFCWWNKFVEKKFIGN